MPNLAAALMAAAEKYEKAHIRADFCIGTYTGTSILIYTGSGQKIELDPATEVMYTESLIWHTLYLKHDHGGTVPADLAYGTAGRRWHPDGPPLTDYGHSNPMKSYGRECWTLQDNLTPGDTLLLMRVANGKQYIALSKLYSYGDTQG